MSVHRNVPRRAHLLLIVTFALTSVLFNAALAEEAVPPSMAEFNKINNGMSDDPASRNYPAILTELKALCDKYPGTEAAKMAVIMVTNWQQKGLVTEAQAAPFAEVKENFLPAESELRAIEEMRNRAEKTGDKDALKEAVSKLESLRDKYRSTYVGYVAAAMLPEYYRSLGDNEKALSSVRSFLGEYKPGATGYSGASSYEYASIFSEAGLTASVEGADAGLRRYLEIAEKFGNRKSYLMQALFDAGELAIRAGKPSNAKDLFARLIKAFPDDSQETLIIARFRMGEAMLRLGEISEALALFEELQTKYANTRFAKDAGFWIDLSHRAMADPRVLPWYTSQAEQGKLGEAIELYVNSTGQKEVAVDYSDILEPGLAPKDKSVAVDTGVAQDAEVAAMPSALRIEFPVACALGVSVLALCIAVSLWWSVRNRP